MEDLKKVNSIFNDSYKLYKKYAATRLSDDELMQLVAETEVLRKKYECSLANDILLAVINELDKAERYMRRNNDVGRNE